MVKIVDLCLDGDSENLGFRVTLTIAEEGYQPDIQKSANLPASPELSTQLQHHWQEKYRTLGAPYRIKPKAITLKRSFKEQVQECNESADKLRKNLNTWLDSEKFRLLDKELRTVLNKDDEIRFLIRTDSQELHKLPWEEWEIFKSYPKAGFGLAPTKYERIKTTTSTYNSKVRILAILGNSEGINIDTDRQLLESLPNVETVFLVEKTRKEINDQLWEQSWDILFFAGHSETEGETGKIYINPTDSLTIDELWYGLNKAVNKGLRIAIFNSCDGLGLARQLESMNLHIPQMIVMRELVPDRVAQEFLKYFLTAFSRGESFDLAVREAKERLKGMESDFPCASWLPVIWQNPTEVPPKWEELFTVPEPGIVETEPEIVGTEVVPLPHKRKFGKRSLLKVLIASFVITCLVMEVRHLGILQDFEMKVYDHQMLLRPDEGPDNRILIVKITEEDLKLPQQQQRVGSLSDSALNQLLKKLDSYQPRAIGLNIFRDHKLDPKYVNLKTRLSSQNNLFTICHVGKPEDKYPGISPPSNLPEKRQAFSNVLYDRDNIIRRHLLSMNVPATSPCTTPYALSVKLALHYLKAEGITDKFLKNGDFQVGDVVFTKLKNQPGFYKQSDTWGTQVMLNYRSYGSPLKIAHKVTLADVLNNQVNPELVKDSIILIGAIHSTSREFMTPYSADNSPDKNMPGVILQAQMVSQILSAVQDKRPLIKFLDQRREFLWFWGCSLTGGFLAWLSRSRLYFLLSTLVTLTILYGLGCYFLTQGYWVSFLPSAMAFLFTGSLVLGLSPLKLPLRALLFLSGGLGFPLLLQGFLIPLVPSVIAFLATGATVITYRVFQTRQH